MGNFSIFPAPFRRWWARPENCVNWADEPVLLLYCFAIGRRLLVVLALGLEWAQAVAMYWQRLEDDGFPCGFPCYVVGARQRCLAADN